MKNVYDHRAQHVEMKKKFDDEANWLLQHERQNTLAEIERQQKELEEKKLKDALYKKSHQNDILRQVNERDRTQRREIQEKMFEERAAKLAELNYVRKIDS